MSFVKVLEDTCECWKHIKQFSGKYLITKPLKTMDNVGLGGWQQFQGASQLSSLLETDFQRTLAQQTTFFGMYVEFQTCVRESPDDQLEQET